MKNVSNAVKVGILVLLVTIGGYATFKSVGERASGDDDYKLKVQLRDASGLPEGSRVVIAGLPVGEIDDLAIQGRYALLTMKLRDIPIYDNAIAMKKSSSLLGDYYIEIDPGTPTSVNASGTQITHERLPDGAEIPRVIEATSPDALMRRIEESLPKLDQVLVSVRDLSEDVRALVNGPIASMANRMDRLVNEEAENVSRILASADRAMANIERITTDIRKVTDGADEKVNAILDEANAVAKDARELIASTQREIEETGKVAREKLDLVDEVLERSASVMTKVDENKGTLGRLVNDSKLADDLEDITGSAKGFVKTLFGMQTWVGLRSEYNVFSAAANNYVTVELRTRPDKFYLIEFNRGPRGDYPENELIVDPINDPDNAGEFQQRVVIRDKTRLTFMFGKRIDWLSLRFGIKESTGGIGVDGQWFDDRLKLSIDIYDTTFNRLPRLKVAAAYSMFKHIYFLAGVDDALNDELIITAANPAGPPEVPQAFNEVRFGRDIFFGAYIQFNDLDLTALLTIGSGILLAAAD